MYTKWAEHLDVSDKGKFELQVLSAKPVLDRLIQLLDEMEDDADISERSLLTYDRPNWAERQAHTNGYRSAIHTMKKLINLDQQKGIKVNG